MKSKQALFSLIQSMTSHEKRYYRLYADSHEKGRKSHLHRLFNLLETQPDYDESEIKIQLEDDPLGRQFAVYKNLLFHSVLRSLQSYRYEDSPSRKVRSGIDKIELLVEKGHHQAALKMLLRTRNHAEEFAQNGYLNEILNWERRLLRHLNPLGFLNELPRIEAYERKLILMGQQEAEALRIYDRLFAWAQVERRMEKSSFSDQLSAIGDALSTLEDAAYPSFNTLTTISNAQALYRQLSGDYPGMMEAYGRLVALWDEHPKIKNSNPGRYARLQIAWLNSTLAAGKVGHHLPTIRSLRKMPIEKMADRARTVFQSYNLELLWLLDQKDVDAAIRFLPAFEEKLPQLLPYLGPLRMSSFYLNAAFLYFEAGDYKRALSWASRLQAIEGQHQATLLFRSAFLVSVICNCEIGDFSLAESQLRTIKRRLKLRDSDWEFGQVVAAWLKKLLPKWGLPEFKNLKQAFLEDLEDIERRGQPVPFMLDLIKSWAQEA